MSTTIRPRLPAASRSAPRSLCRALVVAAVALAAEGCAAPRQRADAGLVVIDQVAFARRFEALCRLTDGGASGCSADADWQ